MKTYLITGGAGFIGSNFVIYMLQRHENILLVNLDKLTYAGNLENLRDIEGDPRYVFVQGDVCDHTLLCSLFHQYAFDYVIHFAAESHVDRSIQEPDVFAKTNVLGTLNLLNCAKAAWQVGEDRYREGVKFVQISTDEVYGSLGAEGYFTETTPLDPHSPYAASKASADLFVKAYYDTYHLPVCITRCSNNYGPFQFPEKLIPLMINNALGHRELPVYGDGMQVRDWLYVEDHCRAIDLVAAKAAPGEIYNIGGHNEKTNREIIDIILEYMRREVDPHVGEHLIRYVEDRKGHDRRYGIDPKKIGKELGWSAKTMFTQGIVQTIQWYLDNRKWLEQVTSGNYRDYYEKMYKHR